jgi:hypothetical protein
MSSHSHRRTAGLARSSCSAVTDRNGLGIPLAAWVRSSPHRSMHRWPPREPAPRRPGPTSAEGNPTSPPRDAPKAFANVGGVGDTGRVKLDDYLDSFQQVLDHPRHRAAQETLVELIRQLRAAPTWMRVMSSSRRCSLRSWRWKRTTTPSTGLSSGWPTESVRRPEHPNRSQGWIPP